MQEKIMDSHRNNTCSPGYWTGEIETEAAALVSMMPKVINACVAANAEASVIGTDNLSSAIYHNANNVLKLVNGEQDYPAEKIKIKKLCEIDVLPKVGSGAVPLSCCVYHVVPDDHKHINFFYVTHGDTILSYARFHIKQKQMSTAKVYGDQPILSIEAMQTYQRGIYSFGTVLAQMIYEYSVNNGFDGRVALYSANESAQFYYKSGFTPLEPSDYNFISAGGHMDGKVMFFTDAAISQWIVRASQAPILLSQENVLRLNTNEIVPSSVSTSSMFRKESVQTEAVKTPGSVTPTIIGIKK